jgi:hypothetical protein
MCKYSKKVGVLRPLALGHCFRSVSQRPRANKEVNSKTPVPPIRLMNLTTYGESITKRLGTGAVNFAQIN